MVVVELSSNAKIGRLSDREFRCLIEGVWPLAAKANPRGFLVVAGHPATAGDVARQAHCSERVADATLAKMRALRMLEDDEESGFLYVHDWEKINPEPKVDATAAERQRKRRQKLRDVTEMSQPVTRDNRDGHAGEVEVEEKKNCSRGSTAVVTPFSSASAAEDERATDEDVRLCRLLAELLKARNPKAKVRSRNRWLREMRLLRERDGNSAAEIERAIRWLFTDPGSDAQFWADVVQSPANLREHYAQIWAKMTSGAARKQAESVEDSAAFLSRRGAA